MKIRLLAGAACAALTVLAAPAFGASSPALPGTNFVETNHTDRAVDAFYAQRGGAPLWLRGGADSAAARELIGVLQRAPLDGLASGPALAAEARSLLARAASGDRDALVRADRMLSTAWVLYVQALQRPAPGMTYADSRVAPRQHSASQILDSAASAPSLAGHVRDTSTVNPLYAQLRDAAWAEVQANGGVIDNRIRANLDRLRQAPTQDRYLMVDAAGARLFMIEGNQIVDSMKVIVGKPSSATPMLASTIYYATLNPYWNVPGDLVRTLIAPRVLSEGVGYLKAKGYQVLEPVAGDAAELDPAKVDWAAVKAGTQFVRVRQLPGPGNSMGRMKFGFPNSSDIFLHDTPAKDLFAQASRDLSNGCIRLEDAQRLGRWLLGREPVASSRTPEQHVSLPRPVPVYVTYMTAQPNGGRIAFVNDVYGRDSAGASQVAALR